APRGQPSTAPGLASLQMRSELERDFERFKRELPGDFSDHVRETYGIDLTARYLGETILHPIGKGSGQLSLNENQLADDARAGLLADTGGDEARPLLVEQDYSPTLAGDSLAGDGDQIIRWLREVPGRIRAASPRAVRIAVKLMNARFDDAFQLEMMRAAAGADGLVCFNRLFDPEPGVAYGGWDLSDRNLRVLDLYRPVPPSAALCRPLCGTGNICSGRMIVEYARRGCESVQLHTFFQLPLSEYPATHGSRTQRALHAL